MTLLSENSKKNDGGALFSSCAQGGVCMLQEYDATVMRARVYTAATFSLSFSFFFSLFLFREEMDWMLCGSFFSFPSEKPPR
jgi:hypothetical protein